MTELPATYRNLRKNHPKIAAAHEALGEATQSAGPLDQRTRALVKLAMSVGARHEGAVHAHTRKALDAGATPEDVRHVALLATTTLGFPTAMATLTWIEDVVGSGSPRGRK